MILKIERTIASALLLVLLIGAVATLPKAQAQLGDPSVRWERIETEHFTVIYDSKQQSLGRIYAAQAEQAFKLVAPAFGIWPSKTVILVDDGTDLSNGSATPWPYPTIIAYPVLPLSSDVVGEYGDWGLELLTHEYTHILNFEPATGIFRPLRWIFGSIVRPNVLLPRWYSEGLAVEMETRTSKFGRLRSGSFLSIARAMVEDGSLRKEDIGRINESIPEWPGGNRPYLMGALIWDEITRLGGDKVIGELNLAYSRNLPFFIDRPLRKRLGLDYSTLLSKVYDRVEQRSLAQIASIKAAGIPKEELIAHEGFFAQAPSISPNGQRLAFVARAHNIMNYLVIKDRGAEEKSFSVVKGVKLLESDDINRISWLPDSNSFVFDSVDTVKRYYSYSDLWRCDLSNDKSGKLKCKPKRLTRAMRAREPAVSPDARSIVFIQNTAGSTRLASVRADGTELKILYTPSEQTRVAEPTFLSREDIAFSERTLDGREVLRVLKVAVSNHGDLAPRETPKDILARYSPARAAELTSEGLIFISDRNGVSNYYLARGDLQAARPLTNTTTRILNGSFDSANGDLVYAKLESKGASIFSMPFAEGRKLPVALPSVSPMIDSTYPDFKLESTDEVPAPQAYSSAKYLIPRYWFPYGYFLPGGVYTQASTSASDPVGRHAYSLTAAYDTLSAQPSFFGQYLNATTSVPISIAAQDIHEYLYGSNVIRRTTAGALSGSFFLPKASNNYRGSLGWQYLQTEQVGSTRGATERSGVRASIGYKNVSQMGYEISPEKGGSATLAHSHYIRELGNVGYDQTELSFSKFFSEFLPERHAVAFFANASLAPSLKNNILGRSTVGGSYQNGLIQDAFVMRGYGSGVFLGKNMISGTAEYRFPLSYNYRGLGTTPFFFKRMHADLFVDGITLDGFSFDDRAGRYRSEHMGKVYFGVGGELKFDATVFYFVPIQFILGAYHGLDKNLNPNGVFPFLGIGI